jgi:hypothetical protein
LKIEHAGSRNTMFHVLKHKNENNQRKKEHLETKNMVIKMSKNHWKIKKIRYSNLG